MEINEISGQIVDAAMKVHSALGPGLLENALGYRLDLLVEDAVIVELKAVEKIAPIHEAQLLSYLKLSGKKIGLLLNFNVLHLKDGIKRMVNGL